MYKVYISTAYQSLSSEASPNLHRASSIDWTPPQTYTLTSINTYLDLHICVYIIEHVHSADSSMEITLVLSTCILVFCVATYV